MGLTIRCDAAARLPENLSTDICNNIAFKWQLSVFVTVLLLAVGVYLLHKWRYRRHATLLLFHNLRAAVALLLLAINTLELARALLPMERHEQWPKQQQSDILQDTDHVLIVIGSDLLWNAMAAILLTVMLMCYHRIVELKKAAEFLYITCVVEFLIFFVRILELAEITSFQYIYELEASLQLLTALCLFGMAVIDGFTIYKERYRPDYTLATFYSKACFWWLTPLLWFGYKEPLELEDLGQMRLEDSARAHYDRFLFIYRTAKVKNGERPPSLWLCYVKSSWRMFTLGGLLKLCGDLCALIGPLAIQQIVQYIENMYNATNIPVSSSWTEFNNSRNTNVANGVVDGGVGFVSNSSITPWRSHQQLFATDDNYSIGNNTNSNSFTNFHDNRRISLRTAATNWISNTIAVTLLSFNGQNSNNTSNTYSSNTNSHGGIHIHVPHTNANNRALNAGIDYTGTEVQIHYPTWWDLLSNGWTVAWIVLLSALAQGALSQASTHILNMTGIRMKTSLQGLIYRKTLLLNSSVGSGAGGGDGAGDGQAPTNNEAHSSSRSSEDDDDGGGKGDTVASVNRDVVVVDDTASGTADAKATTINVACDQAEDANAGLSDVGTITNLMSEDALNVMSFFWIAHYVWAIPLKIGVVMYLLYIKLGVAAIIGSFVCILTMTPLQFLIGRAMSLNTEKMAKSTDQRLRIIHDTLLGIKAIKFNVWTAAFIQRIDAKRKEELSHLFWDSVYWTLMTILTHISSVLITYVTLAAYVSLEGEAADFSASRLFSALALFQQLTVPLLIFPITVPIILSAVVSTRRLERFLSAREIHKQFEGIRHMARILSKSDASLDYYEMQEGRQYQQQQQPGDAAQRENKLNERLALKLNLPESPAPLAQSEPQTPLLTINETTNPMNFLAPTTLSDANSPCSSGEGVTADCDCTAQPCLTHCEARTYSASRRPSQQRRELLRNSPYVFIRPRKFPNAHAPATQQHSLHRHLETWSRDSLLLKLSDDMALSVREARFAWHPQRVNPWMLNLKNVTVPRGKLTVIVGGNGSGKTSFLSAMLMEMPLISGDIIWNKTSTIAFVPQQPWLLNASIRENILFGESFRPRRYDFVLEACALKPDIELMPDADFTVIGERGINLSGGQRQRVAIARALYSSANVVIMDDPLSSLDNEVANHIFAQSIQRMLLKAKRTVILATQQLQLTKRADYLIVMEDGHLQATGSYKEIELKHPHITANWQSIVAKANEKESSKRAAGRTAHERWKLYQNITKLGLQRAKSTKLRTPIAPGTRSDSIDAVLELGVTDGSASVDAGSPAGSVAVNVDVPGRANTDAVASLALADDLQEDDEEEDEDLLPVSLTSLGGGRRSSVSGASQGNFTLTRSRSSLYGSRHLFYDAPLPIDECQTDEVILRRRRSQRPRRACTLRHQQRPDSIISTGSSRLSAISSTNSSDWRHSCSSAGSQRVSADSGSSLLSMDTGVDVTDAIHPAPRVHSWQPQSAAEVAGKLHQPVTRNASSPSCLLTTGVSADGIQQKQQTPDKPDAADELPHALSGSSFQQFLRRMSMRRSVGHRKHRPTSGTNPILSIKEESAPTTPNSPPLPSIQLSVSTPEGADDKQSPAEIDSWIVHIENEKSVKDSNIDYKTLTDMTNAAKREAATAAGGTTTDVAVAATAAPGEATDPEVDAALAPNLSKAATSTAGSVGVLGYDSERKYGKIPAQVYLLYLRASGWRVVLLFCVTALIWQAMRIYTDVWLQQWTVVNSTTNMTQAEDVSATLHTTQQTSTTAIPAAWHSDTLARVKPQPKATDYTKPNNNSSEIGNGHAADIWHYFHVYTVISCVCILMALISTPAGQLAGCNARRHLHEELLLAVMRKSLHFFQVTPLGRLMNRFSSDMAIIDKKIAATSQRLLQFGLLCLCAVLINVSITPWFVLLTLPICAAYYAIQKFYRCSARELQRIENSTNSPVISHLSETIQGVTTIRAYNQESRFTEILFKRLEANTIAFTILNTSNRWLGISLDFLGGVIVFLAIITALVAATISCQRQQQRFQSQLHTNSSSSSLPELTPTPSLVGLAINYTLLMPIYLNWVVKLLADMEMYVGSVERIAYYTELNKNAQEVPVSTYLPEANGDATVEQQQKSSVEDRATKELEDKLASAKCPSIHFEVQRVEFVNKCMKRQRVASITGDYITVPISWPRQGDISFENVSLRYEGQQDEVIKNLTLKIPFGQRIGICGRTGSGKSSLAMSLLGVLQATSGRICVDDVDITRIHPDELRMRISIIPQDVHLFNLSIRENLNPTNYYCVTELQECLRKVGLRDFVSALPADIDTIIGGEDGVHLSAGQRQLLALARILLRGSVCLILDEATSSLDSSAERDLLNAAHNSFRGRTIMTIAHRLSTILDYDRIIVLEQGRIVEDGTPAELQQRSNGTFNALLHAGQHFGANAPATFTK